MALINCPECSKEISDTVKKCPNCGYKFKKKKSIVFWIIIAVVVLIVLGVVGFFGFEYYSAGKLMKEKKYEASLKQYNKVAFIPGTKNKINEAKYCIAGKEEDISKAITLYSEIINYKDSRNKISELEKKQEEIEKEEAEKQAAAEAKAALDAVKSKFRSAYSSTKGNTTLGSDSLSIIIDSWGEYDTTSLKDVVRVNSALDLPDTLLNSMETTSALMGKQTKVYGDIEVRWSYHPDYGLDVEYTYIGDR